MEERMKILDMLASGTINASEANELLSTLDKQKVEVTTETGTKNFSMGSLVKGEIGKTLHIKVESAEGDTVNINVPIAFLKAAIKSGTAKDLINKSVKSQNNDALNNIDPDLIISSIESGMIGKIVDIKSAEGDVVEIFID